MTQDGWTSLMIASDSGHEDIVFLLLERGAVADHQNNVRDITFSITQAA